MAGESSRNIKNQNKGGKNAWAEAIRTALQNYKDSPPPKITITNGKSQEPEGVGGQTEERRLAKDEEKAIDAEPVSEAESVNEAEPVNGAGPVNEAGPVNGAGAPRMSMDEMKEIVRKFCEEPANGAGSTNGEPPRTMSVNKMMSRGCTVCKARTMPINDFLSGSNRARHLDTSIAPKKQKPPVFVSLGTFLDNPRWEKDLKNSSPAQSPKSDLYNVPEIDKPLSNYKYVLKWPQFCDRSLVPISLLGNLIHDVRAYSDKMIDQDRAEWKALRPNYWLPMLEDICKAAQIVARKERTRMERDLQNINKIVTMDPEGLFDWPICKMGHHSRHDLHRLLVKYELVLESGNLEHAEKFDLDLGKLRGLAPVDSNAEQYMWDQYYRALSTVKSIAPLLNDIFRNRRYRGALAFNCGLEIVHMFRHLRRYAKNIEELRDQVCDTTTDPEISIDTRQYGTISVSQTKEVEATPSGTREDPPPFPASITVTPQVLVKEYIAILSDRWTTKRAKMPIGTKAEDMPEEPDLEAEANEFVRTLIPRLEREAREEAKRAAREVAKKAARRAAKKRAKRAKKDAEIAREDSFLD